MLDVEHPGTLMLGEFIPPLLWGSCWAGLGVKAARSHGHLWKSWHPLSVWAAGEGWAVRMRTFWEPVAVTAGNVIRLGFMLVCACWCKPPSSNPSKKSRGPGKNLLRSCQGSGFQPYPLGTAAPMYSQNISTHLVKFQLRCLQHEDGCGIGACWMKQGVSEFDPQKVRFRCKLRWKSQS